MTNWIAWASGFFEGEGCIYLCPPSGTKNKKSYVRLHVSQKNMEPLEKFQILFGGTMHTRKDGCSILTISRRRLVEEAMEAMTPYLSQRRLQRWEEVRSV